MKKIKIERRREREREREREQIQSKSNKNQVQILSGAAPDCFSDKPFWATRRECRSFVRMKIERVRFTSDEWKDERTRKRMERDDRERVTDDGAENETETKFVLSLI